MADVDVIKWRLPKTATGAASARRWSAVGATYHGQRRRAIPPGGGRRNCRKLTASPEYCVIPFLLPPAKTLKTCYDPEIPVNIVDLGLAASSPPRPRRRGKIAQLPSVKQASVEVVFEPSWDPSMMSEAARLELGMM